MKYFRLPRFRGAALLLFLAIVFTHYLESIQLPIFEKVRNLIYFGLTRDSESSSDGILYSRYKDDDGFVFNPVKYIQTVQPSTYTVLNGFNGWDYYDKSACSEHVDTSGILSVCSGLMNYVDSITVENVLSFRLKYNFPWVPYNLQSGWYSGMAQGHAAEIMLAAFVITGDSIYIKRAECFLNLLDIDIEKGGVRVVLDDKHYWYEEYAQSGFRQSSPQVLNGHIFALDGLYFLSLTSSNSVYKDLYDKGLAAVEHKIEAYNIGKFWSRYDICCFVANGSYHRLHIDQLERLIKANSSLNLTNIVKQEKLFKLGKIIPLGIFYRLYYNHNLMLILMTVFNLFMVFLIYEIYHIFRYLHLNKE